jgi:tetratricopeptide (TPR) repeat protein
MLSRNGIILIVAVALLVGVASGARTATRAAPRRGADPAALYALYSVDFDQARESFRQMTLRSPEDPEAWNLLASALWLQIVFRQEKLNLDSFTGDALGTEDSNEVVSEEQEAALRRTLDRAIEAAEAILEKDPDNLEARYQLGVAYGTLSTFEAIAKKSYLAANRAGKKARELHVQVLDADPGFADARLTVGAYDYAVGVIPWGIRVLLGVFGIRGDKEEGIRELQWAAELGDRAAVNAKMVLVVVYNREKQYDRALPLLKELHAAYPRNYLVEVAIGGVYERTKSWAAAIATYRSVLDKMESGVDDYDRFEPEPVLFRLAETYVQANRFREAVPRYEELVADPDTSDGLRCRSHMRAGRLLKDQLEAREAAARHFRAIQDLPCSRDLKREARRAL